MILFFAAEINRNNVEANSTGICPTLQGWINDSVLTIGKIPYFCFNDTKFYFYRYFYSFSLKTYDFCWKSTVPPMTNVSVPYVMEVPYRILIMPFFQLQILSSCKSNDLITWENARADVKNGENTGPIWTHVFSNRYFQPFHGSKLKILVSLERGDSGLL